MKQYIAIRIHGHAHVLVVDERACTYLDPEPSQAVVNHSPDGFDWGYGGSGPAQLALAILLDLTDGEHLAESLHQEFKSRFIAGAPKEGFHLAEDEIRNWISTTRPSPYKDQEELIQSIGRMIDKASLRQCYERRDPDIQCFAVVAPDRSLA